MSVLVAHELPGYATWHRGVVGAVLVGHLVATWRRLAVTGFAGLILVLSNSGIGFVFAASVALVPAVLVATRRQPNAATATTSATVTSVRRLVPLDGG
jgi:hypothetical protein